MAALREFIYTNFGVDIPPAYIGRMHSESHTTECAIIRSYGYCLTGSGCGENGERGFAHMSPFSLVVRQCSLGGLMRYLPTHAAARSEVLERVISDLARRKMHMFPEYVVARTRALQKKEPVEHEAVKTKMRQAGLETEDQLTELRRAMLLNLKSLTCICASHCLYRRGITHVACHG